MMRLLTLSLLSVLPFAGYTQTDYKPRPAYRPGVALSVHGGTAGFGVNLGKSIVRQLTVRAGINRFTYNGTLTSGKDSDELQLGFAYKINLSSANLLADFYPFKQAGFRITAGAYYNLNNITFLGKPTKDVRFNDVTFTVDQVGTVDGKASFNRIAPYAGIGWGHPFLRNRLKFLADVGLFYQQSPQLAFNTTGMLEPSNDQGPIIENNLKPLKYYPIISIGFSYNLFPTRF